MSAQTVKYFNGSSKSLSRELLTDLFKGVAHLSLMPFASAKQTGDDNPNAGGIKWADLSFQGADEIFTIKDSFQISQADPSTEDINIDQDDVAIDTTVTAGAWTFNGNIPAIAKELCAVFYDSKAEIASTSPILGQESSSSYQGQAFGATPKEVEAVMLVENRAKSMAVAFARVKITVGVSKDDASNPGYLKMSGTILSNPEKSNTQGDWAVLTKIG